MDGNIMPAMAAAVKSVVVLIGFAMHSVALAFGAEGHRVAGAIAESYLCAEARAWVAPLLEGSTLANAGVWADAIRDDPAWAHTKSWHFINVGDDASLAGAARAGEDNVLAAIRRAERDLADPRLTSGERATALRFFVHFVADVHQPLHVGRAGDRGGNEVAIRWGEESMSLHELWDARLLLRSTGVRDRDLAFAIGALAVGQEAPWRSGGPLDWAEESRAYRPLIYALPRGRGRRQVSDRYVAMARNVVSLRLAQAGVRIADRLNRLACPGAAASALEKRTSR
jgi:hypothetical protein